MNTGRSPDKLKILMPTLKQFVLSHSIDRKPGTQHFYSHVEKIMRDNWPEIDSRPVTADDVLTFGQKVQHYSSSYWNSFVCVIRFIAPEHGKLLKRRKI